MRTVCCSDRLGRGSAWGGSVCPGGLSVQRGVSVQGCVCLSRGDVWPGRVSICPFLGGVYSAGVYPSMQWGRPPFRGQTDTLRTLPFCSYCCGRWKSSMLVRLLPPATKLGQGFVFTGVCDSVNRGACMVARRACMVAGGHAWFFLRRGMHGFFLGGHAWFFWGVHGFFWGACVAFYWGGMCDFFLGEACVVFSLGGHAWFFLRGHAWFFSQGACVVFGGFMWFWGLCMAVGGCVWFPGGAWLLGGAWLPRGHA